MLSARQYHQEYELLVPYHARDDPDLLWRLARVTVLCRDPRNKDDHFKEATLQGFRLARRATELDSEHPMCLLVSSALVSNSSSHYACLLHDRLVAGGNLLVMQSMPLRWQHSQVAQLQ